MKNQFENSLKDHAHLAALRHERLIREEEAQPNHFWIPQENTHSNKTIQSNDITHMRPARRRKRVQIIDLKKTPLPWTT